VGTEYTTTYEVTKKRRTRTVLPEGDAIEHLYDPNHPEPRARGNLLQIRHLPKPGSSEPPLVTSFTYKTPYQQIGTITDPRGKVTEFFYDASHNLERIEFPSVPEGTPEQHFSVNALGQVESMTDENADEPPRVLRTSRGDAATRRAPERAPARG
jgi:YD repeat-containing protein